MKKILFILCLLTMFTIPFGGQTLRRTTVFLGSFAADQNCTQIGSEYFNTVTGKKRYCTAIGTPGVWTEYPNSVGISGTGTLNKILKWTGASSVASSILTDDGQSVTSMGDVEITNSTKGIILKSPNNTRYRVTVSNAWALVVTALP